MTERAYKSYKLKFKFSFEQPLNLPKYYNSVLQGFFYKNMDTILASILHEVGFVYNHRRFKLFTFSKIFGRIRKKTKAAFCSTFQIFMSIFPLLVLRS
jgi:CRISPR-associated endoribonuclease Cas6